MQARELLLVAAAALALSTPARADVLKVKGVTQEQSQWCWAAVSQVVLDFYGHTASQCSIAEYTRQTATWHDFGKKDCCVDPTQGCNYWNYLNTMKGAVIPILQHFGKVSAKLSANGGIDLGIHQNIQQADNMSSCLRDSTLDEPYSYS